MRASRKNWVKGCTIGCGLLVLIPSLALAIIAVRACVPMRSARRSLARLEARFGPPEAFDPAPDGAISAERIEVFLEVRRALAGLCERFEMIEEQLRRVERLDEGPTPSGRDLSGTTKGFAEAAAGIVPLVAEYFDRRNSALLEAEIGLGEYTYIFAMAYREQLLDESTRAELFSEFGTLAPEVHAALRAMLGAQLDAANTAELSADLRRLVEREIEVMERHPRRLAWAEGLPPAILHCLAPYRQQLDDTFCRAAAGIATDREPRRATRIALY